MTLRKTEDTEIWKSDYQIAFSREFAFEVATDLSQDRLRYDLHINTDRQNFRKNVNKAIIFTTTLFLPNNT